LLMKLKLYFALALALSPALALASPKTPTAHLRPQQFHDRAPKARIHQSLPHHA
jgi:hypothetical protein